MYKKCIVLIIILISVSIILLMRTKSSEEVGSTYLPSDVASKCVVSEDELSSWFLNGEVIKDGFVTPANSLRPAQETGCDFYKWSTRMLLWVTSPQQGQHVLNSPAFLSVLPSGEGKFTFLETDAKKQFTLRKTKPKNRVTSIKEAGGGGALLSQQDSLVYFGIYVNDVYAAYLSAQKHGQFKRSRKLNSNFPTTEQDLSEVRKFAQQYLGRKQFINGESLAMELKTSWVDASTLDKKHKFLLMDAQVPIYDRSSPEKWTELGQFENKTLALVGMHIVGSMNGKTQVVWATIEHSDNAADASYTYLSNVNGSVQQKQADFNAQGKWLFTKKDSPELKKITERIKGDVDGNVVPLANQTIGASNVIRLNPWGTATNVDGFTRSSDIISLNKSIMKALAAVGDVRANYLHIGSLWDTKTQSTKSDSSPDLVGSLNLSNTTMETFHQFEPKLNSGLKNCFTCHSTSSGKGIDTSHIFEGLAPLK